MTVIYDNIVANVGLPQHLALTGCENQLIFRADVWGTTQVLIESYSASDPAQKLFSLFTASSNTDWDIPFSSLGLVYRYSIPSADPATTQLFVEIVEPGCCCTHLATPECAEFPIKLVPCS